MEIVGLIVFFVVIVGLITSSLYLMSQEYELCVGKDCCFYLKNPFRDFSIVEIHNSRVLVCYRGKVISVSANKIKGFWFLEFVNREIGLTPYLDKN